MAKFKNGDAVTQVLPAPVQGNVTNFRFDENSGDISYIVTDATGHEWCFREDDIEATPAP